MICDIYLENYSEIEETGVALVGSGVIGFDNKLWTDILST